MDELGRLLDGLATSLSAVEFDPRTIADATRLVLQYLNRPEDNTHENCTRVDLFVMQVLEDATLNWRVENLPTDLALIIQDMGMCLHDAHSNPVIAENFQSTPQQLLARLTECQL